MINKIVSAMFSAICGGSGNSISTDGMSCNFIGGGAGNKITNSSTANSAIVGGSDNTVATTYAGILAGKDNSVDSNGYYSAVVCGSGNHVQQSYSAVLCGSGNTVSYGNSAVIAGTSNKVGGYGCVAMGSDNKITSNAYGGTLHSFVCGQENEVDGAQDCIVCGRKAKASEIHKIVVGHYLYGNVFWVDALGNVYAKSFNIIGKSTSEASTFSAKSSDNPDLSELTAQISEIKADIEALRAENAALRAEIESLKANL